jgi:hypothetical protein
VPLAGEDATLSMTRVTLAACLEPQLQHAVARVVAALGRP